MSGAIRTSGVEVRCGRDRAVGVRLTGRQEEGGVVRFAAELRAPGLTARLAEVVGLGPGGGLAGFLAGLAADFRGWGASGPGATPTVTWRCAPRSAPAATSA
ncbi:DUF6228 family protein [Kitasatospora phosalacinea]|uniref:Uncharacterized protein n=1 Tax=Kitasatospora phosalacinea TaxID=2065 RepID=A0A9W6UN53_9ACTN|nr:DUF6228 family protein [Kitasatospora phosalacinea]GLW54479.1 hypothetical protein Kpho01_24900 [Kitasatospora phosalacinea]